MEIRRFGTVFAIWCAGLGAAAQFGKISVLYPQLAEHYVASAGISFMVSLVGAAGLVFGTTAGLIIHGLGYRRVFVGALGVGAVLSLGQAMLPPLPIMLASRVIEGFSHLAIVVAGPVLIAQAGGNKHQGLVMTLWASFFGVSFAILGWIGPLVAASAGIGGLFLGHAAFMAAMAVVLAGLLPSDLKVENSGTMQGLWQRHRAIYASPWIAAPGLGFVFYTITYVALLTLMPQMMSNGWGPTVATAMPLMSIAVSMTFGVWVLRYLSAVRLVQVGFAIGVVGAVGLWLGQGHDSYLIAAVMILASALGLVQGASFNAIAQLNESATARGQAAGALAQLGNLGTTTGTPLLAFFAFHWGFGGVAIFVAPLCLAGIAVHVWLAQRRNESVNVAAMH